MNEIEFLEKNNDLKPKDTFEYGNFLLDVSANYPVIAKKNELIFSEVLVSENWYLRSVGFTTLLTDLGLLNDRYITIAITAINDVNEVFDTRLSAVTGISVVFFDTRDIRIMQLLSFGVVNYSEDFLFRHSVLIALFEVYGYSSTDMLVENFQSVVCEEADYNNFKNFIAIEFRYLLTELISIGNLVGDEFSNFISEVFVK